MPRYTNIRSELGADFLEAMRDAFDMVGGVEYLVNQAQENPKAFLALMARTIPTEQHQTLDVTHLDLTEAMRLAAARANAALHIEHDASPATVPENRASDGNQLEKQLAVVKPQPLPVSPTQTRKRSAQFAPAQLPPEPRKKPRKA